MIVLGTTGTLSLRGYHGGDAKRDRAEGYFFSGL